MTVADAGALLRMANALLDTINRCPCDEKPSRCLECAEALVALKEGLDVIDRLADPLLARESMRHLRAAPRGRAKPSPTRH